MICHNAAAPASIVYHGCMAGGIPLSCDFLPGERKRIDDVPRVIAEDRELCVRAKRRTHRAEVEEKARRRLGNLSSLTDAAEPAA